MIKTHLQSKIFITIINIALYITISLLLIAITNIALVGSFDYPLGKRDHSLIIAIPLALFLFLNRKNKLNLFIAITLWMTFVYPTLMVKNLGIPDGRTIRDITVATTESNLFSIVTATVLTTLLSYASHASDRVVQIGTQILLRVIWCTALILPISFYFYWLFANSLITPNVLIAVFQTTPSEALEYLSFRGPKFTIGIVLILFIIIAVNILLTTIKSRSCQNISHNPIIHPIIIACGIFCLYMTSNNYIMQPLRDAITTIQEFNTFKAGIAKRQKNIEPLLQNLKNQGDSGLFVVVLGESQTKTHMSAYGYARMTTPWLNSKLNDKNFIIFNNAFSASISTVPALSQALTAINQYSSLNLAQAPSILEIAKSTGYETWWLSNQNQFGAWDTPITIGGFHKFEKVENPRCQPPPIELYRYASSLSTDSMLRLSCKRSC